MQNEPFWQMHILFRKWLLYSCYGNEPGMYTAVQIAQ